EVPLDLEPGVGAHVERVADHGVAGADRAREHHRPVGEVPQALVQVVDECGAGEPGAHGGASSIRGPRKVTGSRPRRTVSPGAPPGAARGTPRGYRRPA